MPLGGYEDDDVVEGIEVRSALNNIKLPAGDTVSVVYQKCKQILNLEGNENLTVVVDGESHSYTSVANSELLDGSIVEFVKASGTKGQ